MKEFSIKIKNGSIQYVDCDLDTLDGVYHLIEKTESGVAIAEKLQRYNAVCAEFSKYRKEQAQCYWELVSENEKLITRIAALEFERDNLKFELNYCRNDRNDWASKARALEIDLYFMTVGRDANLRDAEKLRHFFELLPKGEQEIFEKVQSALDGVEWLKGAIKNRDEKLQRYERALEWYARHDGGERAVEALGRKEGEP